MPDWVDESLVFWIKDYPARCFFVGNSHTYPGRMSAWDEDEECEFSVSKFEIERLSDGARAWMEGFLFGAEPPPPLDGDANERAEWRRRLKVFHETGDLPRDPWPTDR